MMANILVNNIIILLISVTVLVKGRTRIIGGGEAPLTFGLFHASLQNLTGYHVCGGAIVSKWHVLTAAHCLHGAQSDYIKIITGTTDLDQGGITYDAESINIYRSFNFSARVNDIALIRVKTPFDLEHVRIIGLHEENVSEGKIVFLSGFGAQKVNGSSSNQMHVLTLPVFSQQTCQYAMRYTREVTDSMFCTFTEIGQGTCKGDSGSPIIKDGKLIGLVSWGIPCAVGFPDVHTRVAPYVEWIRKQIRSDICKMKK